MKVLALPKNSGYTILSKHPFGEYHDKKYQQKQDLYFGTKDVSA